MILGNKSQNFGRNPVSNLRDKLKKRNSFVAQANCLRVASSWLLVVGCWLFVVGCWLLVIGYFFCL